MRGVFLNTTAEIADWVAWASTLARDELRFHTHGQEYLPMPPEHSWQFLTRYWLPTTGYLAAANPNFAMINCRSAHVFFFSPGERRRYAGW